MNESLEQALFTVHPDILNRMTWETTGMVLKNEGIERRVWEEWTRRGKDFDPAECAALWEDFYPEGSYIPMTLDGQIPGRRTLLRLIEGLGAPEPEDAGQSTQHTEETNGMEEPAEKTLREKPGNGWENERDAGPAPGWYGQTAPPVPRYADGFPDALPLEQCRALTPRQPEELIRGVLRRGHKMLLAGSSKAGKSFLLMELCIAIAEGKEWLGFPCRQGRVMYVNLEIDPASAVKRFTRIYRAMGIPPEHAFNIRLWNLRGHARPLDQLAVPLIRRLQDGLCDAVIIDPIYKVLTGDENSATEMSAFCNYLDAVCEQSGCAVIYCHHHSKGDQSGKRVTDRASGSGVFARDPDAQLDIIELAPDEVQRRAASPGATAWRMESSLREFPNIEPLDFWFEYPLHRRDDEGALAGAQPPKRSK